MTREVKSRESLIAQFQARVAGALLMGTTKFRTKLKAAMSGQDPVDDLGRLACTIPETAANIIGQIVDAAREGLINDGGKEPAENGRHTVGSGQAGQAAGKAAGTGAAVGHSVAGGQVPKK